MTIYPFITEEDFVDAIHAERATKKFIGLMCPNCYEHIILKSSTHNSVEYLKNQKYTEAVKHLILNIEPLYTVTCPYCGDIIVTEDIIDPNMVEFISILNKKGYETKYSCEGHTEINRDFISYSHPYILFKDKNLKDILKYIPLQGGWYLDTKYDRFSIYWKDSLCLEFEHSKELIKYNNTDIFLYLKRWIDCLPVITENQIIDESILTSQIKADMIAHHFGEPLTKDELDSIEFYSEGRNKND